ncbi:MAG: 5'-methylthioadenosine/adenosylhomocysteine nucleosidase [Lachnospiraceae bacterium]|nr:5'-methylthioadenosine/adenosylhomocysteine nucleosidase [Lachnospiraceae bacterium]
MMKIGIIGAMDVEVAELVSKVVDAKTFTRAGMTFVDGKIGKTPVVVVKSGVGKVNAGICVQILADVFQVSHVINTGVAGSLDNRIDVGDIVVSTDAVYHDVDATVFGYQKGEVPQLGTAAFPADEELRKAAVAAVRAADPDVHVFEGRVASGDQFIASREIKNGIKADFDALCCEMEGCAIAQAAYVNHIPFVIIRAISDKADESVTVSYDIFEKKAAEHCARLVEYMVTR